MGPSWQAEATRRSSIAPKPIIGMTGRPKARAITAREKEHEKGINEGARKEVSPQMVDDSFVEASIGLPSVRKTPSGKEAHHPSQVSKGGTSKRK